MCIFGVPKAVVYTKAKAHETVISTAFKCMQAPAWVGIWGSSGLFLVWLLFWGRQGSLAAWLLVSDAA